MMDNSTLTTITQAFVTELSDAAAGKQTSLPFIQHQLPQTTKVRDGETMQVIAIGGSIAKTALIRKTNDTLLIRQRSEKVQPVFRTIQDLETFVLELFDADVSHLAVNFAYPMQPVFENDLLDGVLLHGTKENTFYGLENQRIGAWFAASYAHRFKKPITVSCANDTVCLLLSGMTEYIPKTFAAGIVGTGINAALFLDEKTIVNLEAANFARFPLSEPAKRVDQHSESPGTALFEKETGGAYLYKHFNELIEMKSLPYSPIDSTHTLKKIACNPSHPAHSLAEALITHSAAYIGCMLAAITAFSGRNLTFIMEGSFFWEENIYKQLVEQTLQTLIPDNTFLLTRSEESTILGAAKLLA
jgi:hexokinase